MTDILQKYIDYGFLLIPLDGKVPIEKDWPDKGSSDIETIKGWLEEGSNIGILTGIASGVIVLDIDGDQGRESLFSLNQPIKTFTVSTGKGTHYYFRTNSSFKNRVGVLPGIDIRADRGQVVAPPSVHPESGKEYKILDDREPAEVPGWLIDLIAGEKISVKKSDKPTFLTPKYDGGEIKPGMRYNTLFRVGCSMRAKDSELNEIYSALSNINESSCTPPLEKSEVEKAAYGACSYKKGQNGEYTATLFKKAENVDLSIRGNIFEYFRTNKDRTTFFNCTILYLALIQITYLNNGEKIFNYTDFISKNYQLSPRFVPKGVRYFESLGILKITERESDGTYKHRDIEFTPNNFNGGELNVIR